MSAVSKIGTRANPTVVVIAVGAVIALIVVAILILSKRVKKSTKYKIEKLPASLGGAVPESWTPTATTNELHRVIYDWWLSAGVDNPFNTDYDIVAKNVIALNDNQKIEIYNDWNDRYFEQDDETLIQAMKGEAGSVGIMGKTDWEIMIDDFERLNLP